MFSVLDASSKLPSGFMVGLVQDLGNYDECLRITINAPITKQYCMDEFHGILPKSWQKYESVVC